MQLLPNLIGARRHKAAGKPIESLMISTSCLLSRAI
jgi:hypothetical protein